MLKWEEKLVQFLHRHILVVGTFIAVIMSLLLRYALRGWWAGDAGWVTGWMATLEADGFWGLLRSPHYNYNILYACILWLAQFLPFGTYMNVRLFSIGFDYLAALALAWVVWLLLGEQDAGRKTKALLSFIGAILLPIPIANSVMWGQCDSMFTCFLLLCTAFILKEKYTPAFTMFAIACCFKMQAIFFLPLLVMLYAVKKKFTLLQFLQAPVLVFLVGLVAIGAGESPFYGILTYREQMGYYERLSVNYPNIFITFADRSYEILSVVGILIAFVALFLMMFYILYKRWDIQGESLILLAVWCMMTCTTFLPGMHDRYGYPWEFMMWIYFFIRPTLKRFALVFSLYLIPLYIYHRVLGTFVFMAQEVFSIYTMLMYAVLSAVVVLALRRANAAEIKTAIQTGSAKGMAANE